MISLIILDSLYDRCWRWDGLSVTPRYINEKQLLSHLIIWVLEWPRTCQSEAFTEFCSNFPVLCLFGQLGRLCFCMCTFSLKGVKRVKVMTVHSLSTRLWGLNSKYFNIREHWCLQISFWVSLAGYISTAKNKTVQRTETMAMSSLNGSRDGLSESRKMKVTLLSPASTRLAQILPDKHQTETTSYKKFLQQQNKYWHAKK